MKKILMILFFITSTSLAQTSVYVPYAVGGATDNIARLITKYNKELIIVNKPGAGGQLAIQEMVRKPGILLMVSHSLFVTNPIIYKNNIVYDPENYEILATVGAMPGVLLCRQGIKINNIKDLLSYEDPLTFATALPGGAEHLNTEILMSKMKNKKSITIIKYAGGGSKHLADLLGGHVDCVFGNLSTFLSIINDKRINVLISTHDITYVKKEIPIWRDIFNEEFYFQGLNVIVVDKRYQTEFKNNIVSELKNSIDNNLFKNDLLERGILPVINFGNEAIILNDKNNDQIKKIIVTNKISF